MSEEKKRHRKKPRGHHPALSYPQFVTHVYGGGWWAPGYAPDWTAQKDSRLDVRNQPDSDGDGTAATGDGGAGGGTT